MTKDNKHQKLSDSTVISPPYDNLSEDELEDIVKELWRITKDGVVKKAWEEKIKEKDLTQKTLFGDGM